VRITFKLFATLQDYLPADAKKTNAMPLELPEGATVAEVVARFALPQKLVHLVVIDGHFVPPDQRADRILKDGETLAIWPPVAGG
jgi:sulfur carrier protein ThiS